MFACRAGRSRGRPVDPLWRKLVVISRVRRNHIAPFLTSKRTTVCIDRETTKRPAVPVAALLTPRRPTGCEVVGDLSWEYGCSIGLPERSFLFWAIGLAREARIFDPGRINTEAFDYYRRLRRVRKLVEEHYDEQIPLDRAAGVACLERKYFSAFFRSKTGVCFRDWLAYQRSLRAAELMRRTNVSTLHVAFAVGFRDVRTFERTFKRCMGVTPGQYKRRVRPS